MSYLFLIIALIITLIAEAKLKSAYAKYKDVQNMAGLTGAQAAKKILNGAGIYDVTIEPVSGSLTDHYDPTKKVVRLSDDVYSKTTVMALGIAAHECGHAIQDAEEYVPLKFRNAMVPVSNIGSKASWIFIIAGVILGGVSGNFGYTLIQIGIIAFSLAVILQLVTLPVEYNASDRAVKMLGNLSLLGSDELPKAKAVLSSAALTYVAAAATSVLQLLRLIYIFGGRRKD